MGLFDSIFSKSSDDKKQQQEELRWWKNHWIVSASSQRIDDCQRFCYIRWIQLPYTTQTTILVSVTATFAFITGVSVGRMRLPWQRFMTINDVPNQYIGTASNIKFVRGRCVQVSDGDTFRFLHIPSLLLNKSHIQQSDGKISDITLPVRVCTIDTPETAKFGKPGQPYGIEAKALLSNSIENKIVYCRFLHKDQYSRLVAEVRYYPYWPFLPWYYQSVDEIMLKMGMAEVYLGSGAVYGYRGKAYYVQLQKVAQDKLMGLWSQHNSSNYESAAQYKARTKS
jgi:micrococcal nuclease